MLAPNPKDRRQQKVRCTESFTLYDFSLTIQREYNTPPCLGTKRDSRLWNCTSRPWHRSQSSWRSSQKTIGKEKRQKWGPLMCLPPADQLKSHQEPRMDLSKIHAQRTCHIRKASRWNPARQKTFIVASLWGETFFIYSPQAQCRLCFSS